MLVLHAGPAAPPVETGGWTVTTSIAAAAALISLITLIVTTVSTTRREDRKWARDALSQAFYELIDSSTTYMLAMSGLSTFRCNWGWLRAIGVRRTGVRRR